METRLEAIKKRKPKTKHKTLKTYSVKPSTIAALNVLAAKCEVSASTMLDLLVEDYMREEGVN